MLRTIYKLTFTKLLKVSQTYRTRGVCETFEVS